MIEQAIMELNLKLYEQYGIKNAIHTVVMTHETFDKVVIDLFKTERNNYSFRPSSMNDCHVCGVKVLAREKVVAGL